MLKAFGDSVILKAKIKENKNTIIQLKEDTEIDFWEVIDTNDHTLDSKTVIIKKYCGQKVILEDVEYLIVDKKDVIAILEIYYDVVSCIVTY